MQPAHPAAPGWRGQNMRRRAIGRPAHRAGHPDEVHVAAGHEEDFGRCLHVFQRATGPLVGPTPSASWRRRDGAHRLLGRAHGLGAVLHQSRWLLAAPSGSTSTKSAVEPRLSAPSGRLCGAVVVLEAVENHVGEPPMPSSSVSVTKPRTSRSCGAARPHIIQAAMVAVMSCLIDAMAPASPGVLNILAKTCRTPGVASLTCEQRLPSRPAPGSASRRSPASTTTWSGHRPSSARATRWCWCGVGGSDGRPRARWSTSTRRWATSG